MSLLKPISTTSWHISEANIKESFPSSLHASKFTDFTPLSAASPKNIKSNRQIHLPHAIINPHITPGIEEYEENGRKLEQKQRVAPNLPPLTPLGFLERAAVVYGNSPSIVHNDIKYTWSETYTRCLKMCSSIESLGIKKGDVVSVVSPNTPEMYELQFSVPMTNAILNCINYKLDPRTLSLLLQHSESKLLFVDYQSSSLVLEAISQFPSSSKPPLLILITDQEKTPTKFQDTYENMVRKGDPGYKWVQPENEWDPITLNYTSGTTNNPKGVVHSHRGRFLMAVDALLDWGMCKEAVYLWTLPLFHANGWSISWATAAVGATNVCLRSVHASAVYEAIEKYNVTHMCGAPSVINMLVNFPGVKPLKSPVHILTAGAPPPAAVLGRAESLGFILSHGYGLTETGGLVVTCAWKSQWDSLPPHEKAILKSRQGVRSAFFTEMDVVDPTTNLSVKHDGTTKGEVVLRGGSVMLGYLKDPKGTSNCMKNGWFYTGDIGVIHPDGYMEIKDRSKDIIISGGENISSVEVESILYTHPAVNEVAVVAEPDKFWGETPCAFVSLKENINVDDLKPNEKDVREFCKAKLPLYMVPRRIVFKDELPKTSTGKIQKFLLREMAKTLRERHDLE